MMVRLLRAERGPEAAEDDTAERIRSRFGQGQPLAADVRSGMENDLGHDFGGVMIHRDAEAASLAGQLGARAFTTGQQVFFGAGAYDPASSTGKATLAHELTHTVQQTGPVAGREVSPGLYVSDPHDSEEREATAVAQQLPVQRCGDHVKPGCACAEDEDRLAVQRDPITLPPIDIVATPPASLRSVVGTLGYYQQRNDDFNKRADPGETPPPYYISYGHKYALRFSLELKPHLSAAGQVWVEDTLRLLQQYMEDRRDKNPWEFAELERNGDAFRDFAYKTHSDAYVNAGVCSLPIMDQIRILGTPEGRDILSLGGVGQILESAMMCMGIWFAPEGMAPWGPQPADMPGRQN
jgi:hypothetical protein